jgi:two-component sensor histidine kinase
MQINHAVLAASWRAWISNDNRAPAGPWWLQWLWTLLFCAGLAVPFTVLGFLAFAGGESAWRNLPGWAYWYGKNFVVCLTVGVVVHLLFDLTRWLFASPTRIKAWRPWQRAVYFSAVPMLGVALGWPLGVTLSGNNVWSWFASPNGANIILGTVLMSLVLTFVIYQFFAIKTRQLDAERRASEAQLRLLQAQIEPHFLFNTLANVSALMDDDAPKAKLMLESFTDYLRSSLGSLRHGQATLGSELELARNYLALLKTRMEDRLQFTIESDASLAGARLPALLLQPLVENAIHHGLEPKVEGGHVKVCARRERDVLVLEVADNGLGVTASAPTPRRRKGAGMALSNLRERLQTQYGARATLSLTPSHPGTLATLRVPFELQQPASPP